MIGPIVFLALLAGPAVGQEVFGGPCPSPTTVQNFDMASFSKVTWFEHSKYYSWLEKSCYCVSWTFQQYSAGSQYTKLITEMLQGYTFKSVKTMESKIWPKNSGANNADFYYQVTKQKDNLPVPGTYNYQILATDQTDYAVAWSCKEMAFNQHQEILWILTRLRIPPKATVDAALEAATKAGLTVDRNKLQTVKQDNCNV